MGFSNDELWWWHAYDYGTRRACLANPHPPSPIDPEGIWYDERLAIEAASIFHKPRHEPEVEMRKYRDGAEWRRRLASAAGLHDFSEVIRAGIVSVIRAHGDDA